MTPLEIALHYTATGWPDREENGANAANLTKGEG